MGERSHLSASSGAKTAMTTKNNRMPSPAIPMKLCRYCFQMRLSESFRRWRAIFFGLTGAGGRSGVGFGATSVASSPSQAALTRGSR